MLTGHFTTALIANQKFPKGTLLYFLIVSQLQDLLWFTFHYLGLERTGPSDVFDATLNSFAVDMLYSHDLIPQILWVLIIFFIGKILFKDTKIALVSAALVIGHFILDFFSGHPHHIFGAETQQFGLGNYASAPYMAIGIEAAFIAVTLWYYFSQEAKKGILRTAQNKASIIGLFVFGILFMLSIATISFREWFGIPAFNFNFNSNVPTLILTYLSMIFYLNWFVPKYKVGEQS